MKRVGLFGGSFDPVHNGHIGLAADSCDQAGLDEVVFVPARIQPFKLGRKVTSGEHRTKMLEIASSHDDRMLVSSYELDRDEISYSVNTLRYFKDHYGDDTEIYFITGSDTFLLIDKWYMAEEILRNYSFIVGNRPGYASAELEQKTKEIRDRFGSDIHIVENSLVDVSSSELREMIATGQDISRYVPEGVVRYIDENGLYREIY